MTVNSNYSNSEEKPLRQDKVRVLIDLDGVLRDFVGSLIRVYQRMYPHHHISPVNSRKLEDFFPIRENIYQFMQPGTVEEIMEEADPYPGSLEALHRWKSEFEIVIVTAQPEEIRPSTYLWIGKHGIPVNEVHISYYKSEVEGFTLLDDFADNLNEFENTGRLAVCLDRPWNKDWKGPRVKSVEEFFRLVQHQLHKDKKEDIDRRYFT